jgi:hypothetical protein
MMMILIIINLPACLTKDMQGQLEATNKYNCARDNSII